MSEISRIKNLVMSLNEKERESLFHMLLGDRVKNDVLSILNLSGYDIPPEEEREEFAKNIAEVYIFQGGNKEDFLKYNESLSCLVDQAILDYSKEL